MCRRMMAVLAMALGAVTALAQAPKEEFRAAWISTVANIDWPISRTASPATQKQELVNMLDGLKAAGINAVLFQCRTECDALYQSNFEPWSYWLTGAQGQAPSDPSFDPLAFVIEEAHARGMELHAWMNPYRSQANIGRYTLDPDHPAVENPSWVMDFPTNVQLLNPGIPAVQDYIVDVVMDVVNNYDVDGIHFDDYFYPYPNSDIGFRRITNQDASTFIIYGGGWTVPADERCRSVDHNGDGTINSEDCRIATWRRNNIEEMVAKVHTAIKAAKPEVAFGISPFGIDEVGVPNGIVGLDARSSIYTDPPAWMDAQILDYLTPQLYWPIGGGQDYSKLMPWWATQLNGRHMYTGNALYRGWAAQEILNQIDLNRQEGGGVKGNIYFTTNYITRNTNGYADAMADQAYAVPSIPPNMSWLEQVAPTAPSAFAFNAGTDQQPAEFSWTTPSPAPDGDVPRRYVIYRLADDPAAVTPDLGDASQIVDLAGGTSYGLADDDVVPGNYFYALSSLDQNNNESGLSNAVELGPPGPTTLATPLDGANDITTGILTFTWQPQNTALSYDWELSSSSDFTTVVASQSAISASELVIGGLGLSGETTYFWRVRSRNLSGFGDFSPVFSFTTAFPATPQITSPADDATGVDWQPTFTWQGSAVADTYTLEVATSGTFTPSRMVETQDALTTTSATLETQLAAGETYFARVKAANASGESAYSTPVSFTTTLGELTAPTIIAPTDEQANVSPEVTFTWSEVPIATGYRLQVAFDEAFTNLRVNTGGLAAGQTSFTVTLEAATEYFVRMATRFNAEDSEWSAPVQFFTEGFVSSQPLHLAGVSIQPNPVEAGRLRLQGLQGRSEVEQWRVVDLAGRTLLSGEVTRDMDAIALQGISSGVYLLELQGASGTWSERFVVR